MSKLQKSLKVIAISYIACFAFVFMHFPILVKRAILDHRWEVLIVPAVTVGIVRAYVQFALAGVWPFGEDHNVITSEELIAAKGNSRFMNGPKDQIIFDLNPELRRGQEGRTMYELNPEGYSESFQGAFAGYQSGLKVQVGDYTCLVRLNGNIIRRLTGPSYCFEIVFLYGDRYKLRALKEDESRIARLIM